MKNKTLHVIILFILIIGINFLRINISTNVNNETIDIGLSKDVLKYLYTLVFILTQIFLTALLFKNGFQGKAYYKISTILQLGIIFIGVITYMLLYSFGYNTIGYSIAHSTLNFMLSPLLVAVIYLGLRYNNLSPK